MLFPNKCIHRHQEALKGTQLSAQHRISDLVFIFKSPSSHFLIFVCGLNLIPNSFLGCLFFFKLGSIYRWLAWNLELAGLELVVVLLLLPSDSWDSRHELLYLTSKFFSYLKLCKETQVLVMAENLEGKQSSWE